MKHFQVFIKTVCLLVFAIIAVVAVSAFLVCLTGAYWSPAALWTAFLALWAIWEGTKISNPEDDS